MDWISVGWQESFTLMHPPTNQPPLSWTAMDWPRAVHAVFPARCVLSCHILIRTRIRCMDTVPCDVVVKTYLPLLPLLHKLYYLLLLIIIISVWVCKCVSILPKIVGGRQRNATEGEGSRKLIPLPADDDVSTWAFIVHIVGAELWTKKYRQTCECNTLSRKKAALISLANNLLLRATVCNKYWKT